MHRNVGILGWTAGGLLALSLSACPGGSRMAFGNDQGGPKGPKQKQVQKKCADMKFDTTHASAAQTLDSGRPGQGQDLSGRSKFEDEGLATRLQQGQGHCEGRERGNR